MPEQNNLACSIALSVSEKTKGAKIHIVDDYLWATIESFYSPLGNAKSVFERLLKALLVASENVKDELINKKQI